MFEVSWCVGLYVTILLFEFLPIPLERWGMHKALAAWRKWSGAYVAFAVTLFVFMLSRNVLYAAGAAIVFGAMAWIFRDRGEHTFEPILLAIAAVTLSTMHQSSLGSLYLLMPNSLHTAWWSPVLPVNFFLSSIAAGTALVVLMMMAISKGWHRRLRMPQLAAMGQITFWALLTYLVFRLGDLVLRGRLGSAFSGRGTGMFLIEIVLCGIVPLALLSTRSMREQRGMLLLGTFLACFGIVLNRANVVLFAMRFQGPMPGSAPLSYFPSIFEWGISVGLIALTIFLFGLIARLMPVLEKDGTAPAH
jgi:formate dehydrogenase iron-sulfur subunit